MMKVSAALKVFINVEAVWRREVVWRRREFIQCGRES
jgi:hypothetical protein